MRINLGDRVIEGKIMDRTQAKNIYRQAKANGKKPVWYNNNVPIFLPIICGLVG
ncbi:MAG: hypothetical protein HRT37_13490 [Alteromonadaceae bacterium]|nr:hypothetical protein [Alteromonadaceae bacterium]